ncbi:MAG: DoxX family protein [Pseudomonadota bacterium]
MSLLLLRCAAATLFGFSGLTKAVFFQDAVAEFAALNLSVFVLVATIAVQSVGAFLLAVGHFSRIAALGLAGFTLVATLVAHPVWTSANGFDLRQTTVFLEHLVIIAALGVIVAQGSGRFTLFSHPDPRF